MYITTYQINKTKIVQFLKFNFLCIIKFNFNGGQLKKSRVKDCLQQSKSKGKDCLQQFKNGDYLR